MVKTEWAGGVDQNNVQVSRDSPVLEPVVQNDAGRSGFLDGLFGCHDSVSVLDVDGIRMQQF